MIFFSIVMFYIKKIHRLISGRNPNFYPTKLWYDRILSKISVSGYQIWYPGGYRISELVPTRCIYAEQFMFCIYCFSKKMKAKFIRIISRTRPLGQTVLEAFGLGMSRTCGQGRRPTLVPYLTLENPEDREGQGISWGDHITKHRIIRNFMFIYLKILYNISGF